MFGDLHSAIEDRIRVGDSARSIARRAGLPLRAVQNIIEGHQPSLDRAAKICEVLGLEAYIGPPREGAVAAPAGVNRQSSNRQEILREEMEIVRKAETQAEALRAEIASMAARLEAVTSSDTGRRIREPELIIPTLMFLATHPDGTARTRDIIKHLEDWFRPSRKDAEILKGRKDSRFSQIVRNMISHRKDAGNFIRNGYADYLNDLRGLRITDKGRKLLYELVNE